MTTLFISITILLAALFCGFFYWQKKVRAEIREGSDIEWEHLQKNDPEIVKEMSRKDFDAIFERVHMPRFPGYALATFTAFLISLPVTFALLTGALWGAAKLGALPEPVEVADRLLLDDGEVKYFKAAPPEAALYYIEDLAGFYYFFGMIFVWLIIVAFFMRRYHARRPGYLRDELIRSRG